MNTKELAASSHRYRNTSVKSCASWTSPLKRSTQWRKARPALMNTVKIQLTQGKVALVDAEDDWLQCWKWCALRRPNGRIYAARGARLCEGKPGSLILMHREILQPRSGFEVDHENRNGLDNRRRNLRLGTRSQNNQNAVSRGASSFKGVSWLAAAQKWCLQIGPAGPGRYKGLFDSEKEAALEYDRLAKKLYGKFARLNFQ